MRTAAFFLMGLSLLTIVVTIVWMMRDIIGDYDQ